MGRILQVKVLTKETVKPAHPTPHHLRNFKLSLLDQINFPVYVSTIFLYKANNIIKADQISQRLKSSLSKTLTKFYPFAGTVKDDFSIECNDYGAEYVEALANGFLIEYLQKPDQNLLRDFHPFKYAESPVASNGDPLLRIQVTFFKCGGFAVTICTNHKLIDGVSLGIFVNSWTSAARCCTDQEIVPEFIATSRFPANTSFVPLPLHISPVASNRFVFSTPKINQLKARVASTMVPTPSRVQALTALIWKCARAASRSSLGFSRHSMSVHAMDVRGTVDPPLPGNSVGNSVAYLTAQTSEEEIEAKKLVCLLRKAKSEFSENGIQKLVEYKSIFDIPESIKDKFEKDEIDFYTFSSIVNFPYYEVANFGWGKPVHVILPNYVLTNLIILMDTNDGKDIEATVNLSPEDMAFFERDQELLEFAIVNPPVIDATNTKNVAPLLMSSL